MIRSLRLLKGCGLRNCRFKLASSDNEVEFSISQIKRFNRFLNLSKLDYETILFGNIYGITSEKGNDLFHENNNCF